MRVALVHDWLTGLRGGERVLHELCGLFPDAEIYTLFHVAGSTTERIEARPIRESPLARLPGARRHYRKLLPLHPWAIGRFRLEGYDLVLSTHHAVAKAVRVAPGTPHLCYCLTPMRYVWDQIDAYLGRGARRALAAPLVAGLRRFDLRSATPDRVTRFVAISETVAERVARLYGRRAPVVHPPVDVERIRPSGAAPEPFYLLVAGFVPYKRDAAAIEAFRGSGRRLVVVGDGPGRARLERAAPPEAELLGRVSDAALAGLYARCRALVYPPEEDFGLVPVEAQAAGRPVIALGRGGASETVVPLEGGPGGEAPTGLWFREPTPAAIRAAVERFEAVEARFDPAAIRANAERFSAPRFRAAMRAEVDALLEARRSRPRRAAASPLRPSPSPGPGR